MTSTTSAHSRLSNPLRTVVVGVGRIGFKFHVPAIVRHPGFALVGVADPLAERRDEVASAYGVPGYDSLEAMLVSVRPELVVIASPTAFHVDQACAAFAHRADVLCDKPVSTSVADFDLVLAAARGAGRKFLAYQPARFRSEVRALRQLLDRGVLGRVHLVKRARCNYERRRDWQAFRANGGGMLNNYGSHCLDEMIALLGQQAVRTVFCQTRCVATAGDAEDVVKATLVMENACLFDLDISQACAVTGPSWHVVGEYGAALFDPGLQRWRIRYFRPDEAPPLAAQQGLAAEKRTYGSEELSWQEETITVTESDEPDYYDAAWRYFREGAPPPVSAEESRLLLTLIERCRKSAETGACA